MMLRKNGSNKRAFTSDNRYIEVDENEKGLAENTHFSKKSKVAKSNSASLSLNDKAKSVFEIKYRSAKTFPQYLDQTMLCSTEKARNVPLDVLLSTQSGSEKASFR